MCSREQKESRYSFKLRGSFFWWTIIRQTRLIQEFVFHIPGECGTSTTSTANYKNTPTFKNPLLGSKLLSFLWFFETFCHVTERSMYYHEAAAAGEKKKSSLSRGGGAHRTSFCVTVPPSGRKLYCVVGWSRSFKFNPKEMWAEK